MSIQRFGVGARLSQAVKHGETIYVAGTVADVPSAGVKEQTAQILKKIDAALAHFKSDKTKILSTTVWVANMASYDAMNQAWDAWVPAGHTPARATVETRLARPEFLVEIACVAAA
jgi:enamine deaminase RidA (YjgF/YER057c/UK114 family)